jgi:hypothetical protein
VVRELAAIEGFNRNQLLQIELGNLCRDRQVDQLTADLHGLRLHVGCLTGVLVRMKFGASRRRLGPETRSHGRTGAASEQLVPAVTVIGGRFDSIVEHVAWTVNRISLAGRSAGTLTVAA